MFLVLLQSAFPLLCMEPISLIDRIGLSKKKNFLRVWAAVAGSSVAPSSLLLVWLLGSITRTSFFKVAMESPPSVAIGQYYRTRPRWSKVRCVAYDAPPFDGRYITTISPGTTLGPVENYLQTAQFTTICVRGYWINVWREGVHFAHRVPSREVRYWKSRGWYD